MTLFHIFITECSGDRFCVTSDKGDMGEEVNFARTDRFKADAQLLAKRIGDRILDIPEQNRVAARIGEVLFKCFFESAPLLHKRYEHYTGEHSVPRIALHIPRSLYDLPWEVLREPYRPPDRFLALDGSIVRCDNELPDPRGVDFVPQQLPLRFFYVFSNPDDNPIGGVGARVSEPTGDLHIESIVPATFQNLREKIQEMLKLGRSASWPTGLIFLGHGRLAEGNNGALVFIRSGRRRPIFREELLSDPIPGFSLVDLFDARCRMRLAFICACESAWAERSTDFSRSIVGCLFSSTSLAHFIGAQRAIDVAAAEKLLEDTLVYLKGGEPLDRALAEARKSIRALSQYDPGKEYSALDWWVPVLYTRSTNLNLVSMKDSIEIGRGEEAHREEPSLPRTLGEVRAMGTMAARVFKALVTPERMDEGRLFHGLPTQGHGNGAEDGRPPRR